MAKKPKTASIWRCETCQTEVYAADCPRRLKCRLCLKWMRKVYPR
jgi:hypothetical protein